MTEQPPDPNIVRAPDTSQRRNFFVGLLATVIGIILGAVPAVLGTLFFFTPLLRRPKRDQTGSGSPEEGFVDLGITPDALPNDGSPMAVTVTDDKVDAWNRFENVEVGTVWLRRDEQQGVIAFSSICPHLGCAVDYRMAKSDFYCPCHTSSFDLDGNRTNTIPPRGMDRLEVRQIPEAGGTIWLKYESFRAGTPKKIAIS